jgi:Protein of unknown function (DUF4236)
MPFRFQKRVSTPFGRINLSKSGVSLTEGVPGAHITVGQRGLRTSLGLPGSGLGWYTQSRWPHGGRPAPQGTPQPTTQPVSWFRRHGWITFLAAWLVVGAIGKLFGF